MLVSEGAVHASDSTVSLLRGTSAKLNSFGADVAPVAVTVSQDVLKDAWANSHGILEVPTFLAISEKDGEMSSQVLGCSTCTAEVLSSLASKIFNVEDVEVKLKSRGGLWIDPEFEGDFLLFGGSTPRSMKTHVVSRISQKMKGADYEEVGLYLDLLNEAVESGHNQLRGEYKMKEGNVSLVADAPPSTLLKLTEEERKKGQAKKQWEAYNEKRTSQIRRYKALYHLFGENKYQTVTESSLEGEVGAVHQLTKDVVSALGQYGFSREDFIDQLRGHLVNQPKTTSTIVRQSLVKVCEDMLLYGDDPAAEEYARLAALERRNPVEELQYQAMEKMVNMLAHQEHTVVPDIEPGVFLSEKEKRQKAADAKKAKQDKKKAKEREERKKKKGKKKERKLKRKSKKGKKKKKKTKKGKKSEN